MKIIKAKHYWFCFWVKRAHEMVEKKLAKKWKVQVWWELIHNKPALDRLKSKWMEVINKLEDINWELIIRSHWISDKSLNNIRSHTQEISNATCPYVTSVHIFAKKYEKQWRQVIIIWDWNHPEMIWVTEDLNKPICVADRESALKLQNFDKIWVISQTTLKKETFDEILDIIKTKTDDLEYKNTICNATSERQSAVSDLARICDIVIIIWWKKSSNTKKLEEISSQICPSYKVEYPEEIKAEWFEWIKTVWISAWASTPDWLIEDVEKEIMNYGSR